jgi:hypothetical protein
MFYQAMLGDYEDGILNITGFLRENGLNLVEIEIRHFQTLYVTIYTIQGALDDLNTMLQLKPDSPRRQTNLLGCGEFAPIQAAFSRLISQD